MIVFVKTISGKTIGFQIEPEGTVEDLKKKIAEDEKIPVEKQKLVFAQQILKNNQTIADCNIQNESTVHLIVIAGKKAG